MDRKFPCRDHFRRASAGGMAGNTVADAPRPFAWQSTVPAGLTGDNKQACGRRGGVCSSVFHRLARSANEVEILAQRELEVLQQLGLLYKEIAERLRIGISTVRTHLEANYHKPSVRTRTEAVPKLFFKQAGATL